MKYKTRNKWKNDAGNQSIVPLRLYRPSSLEDLVHIVQEAERCHAQVRAVGSGHSWSDAALTPDFLVEPTGLTRVLELEMSVLKSTSKALQLVEVESGVTIRNLNKHLDQEGLALPNMGGFDGQTIVGVTATSTHGSGTKFGPLTEVIRSFDAVDGKGMIVRVEPTNGITDPALFASKFGATRRLIQSDDIFHALGVGVGCLALVYSVIIEVRSAFWLKEVRTVTTWEAEKQNLIRGNVFRDNDHYELLLNPYALKGVHTCLVTTRNPTPKPHDLPPDKLRRNVLSELLSSLSVTGLILRALFNHQPKLTPDRLNDAIKGLRDDGYTNKSYKVFNIGAANNLPALSAEYGFPMKANDYIKAIDRLLEVAARSAQTGEIYQTGPIAVRFVRETKFFLSPQFARNTAMAEMIVMEGATGSREMLYRYEEAAYEHEGRPHWGHINHVSGIDMVRRMYPRIDDWLHSRSILDPVRRFDSPFTRRLGV